MHPSVTLAANRDSVREIVLRHRVKNMRVFGSVLHGDGTENSGLDLLSINPAIKFLTNCHKTVT